MRVCIMLFFWTYTQINSHFEYNASFHSGTHSAPQQELGVYAQLILDPKSAGATNCLAAKCCTADNFWMAKHCPKKPTYPL